MRVVSERPTQAWSPRKPFLAGAGFGFAFEMAWGSPPACGLCLEPISSGEMAVWVGDLPPVSPLQLAHHRCARRRGGGVSCQPSGSRATSQTR